MRNGPNLGIDNEAFLWHNRTGCVTGCVTGYDRLAKFFVSNNRSHH
jgi:hypothetical protein